MKILILCSNIMPGGGTERALINLAEIFRGVDDTKVAICSICSDMGETATFATDVEIIHLGVGALKKDIIGKIRWYKAVLPLLKKVTADFLPDYIISAGHNVNVMLPYVRNKGCKIIGCEHIDVDTIPAIHRKIMRLIYPKLDGVVSLSLTAKYKLKKYSKRVAVIPNYVNFSNNCKADLNSKQIIMVGRVSAEKGYDRLFPIAQWMKQNYPDWHICIWGDGDYMKEFSDELRKLNLNEVVKLCGATDKIECEYPKAAIFMSTSYTEAMPITFLEAKSCGLPIVCYENEGANELIEDGVDGYLISSGDVASFCEKLAELMEDREKRETFGLESCKSIKKYSKQNISGAWVNFLLSL